MLETWKRSSSEKLGMGRDEPVKNQKLGTSSDTACLLRNSPYMNYSMATPTLLPTGLLPRYSSVATTPVTTYQVSSNPAWMPQYIMQPGMPHVSIHFFTSSP